MEILHGTLIQEHTYGYRKVEVWDEKINDLNAKFKCSRCNKVNISTVGFGSAGQCIHCDGIDYWDLIEVEIDGEFKPLKSAYRILEKRKLIRYEKEKVRIRTEYKFKEDEK
jgi:hypothetical protein